jgi:hypothetical protein
LCHKCRKTLAIRACVLKVEISMTSCDYPISVDVFGES